MEVARPLINAYKIKRGNKRLHITFWAAFMHLGFRGERPHYTFCINAPISPFFHYSLRILLALNETNALRNYILAKN